MRLVRLLQPAQDRDRVRHRGLADEDRLEAPLERGVLLDVLAVLVERRRADAAQFPARQHGLEHVRRVDCAFGGACADDGVQLVDEEDEVALGIANLGEDGLQPLLELAAVLRAREHCADVERPHALALQPLGHVAVDDALREPLDDCGLAGARLADQHRVVLRAAREHLDDATNLLVASDHRVELALLGRLGEVTAELRQRLIRALRILRGDALAATHRLDLRLQLVARDDVEREQQMLGRHVVVLHALRLVQRLVEHLRQRGRHGRLLLRALDARFRGQGGLRLRTERVGVGDELARQLLVEQREHEVLRVELGIAGAARQLLRGSDRFLRLDGELVEIHDYLLSGSRSSR